MTVKSVGQDGLYTASDILYTTAAPLRFIGAAVVVIVAGLYFSILSIGPLWREAEEKRRIWRAVRREQK